VKATIVVIAHFVGSRDAGSLSHARNHVKRELSLEFCLPVGPRANASKF